MYQTNQQNDIKSIKYMKELLFNRSIAYIEVAILSSKNIESPLYNTCEYDTVTAHLIHHSSELFLKSLISAHTRKSPIHEHVIKKLFKRYREIYSTDEYKINFPDIEDLDCTNEQIKQYKSNHSMNIGLQYRYPLGKEAEIYSPVISYETDQLEELKRNMIRIYHK